MSTVFKAMTIAKEAHAGQYDKAGMEYYDHPLRVMKMCKTETEKIVGILHDVVEDSEWTFEMLENAGFSAEIIDALKCLTKESDEDYDHYISRIKTNKLATRVKLNDLRDNMDVNRLNKITDADIERIVKYMRAYKELATHLKSDIET